MAFDVTVVDGSLSKLFNVGDTVAYVKSVLGLWRGCYLVKRHGGTPFDKHYFTDADRLVAGTYSVETSEPLRSWYIWRDETAKSLPRPPGSQ